MNFIFEIFEFGALQIQPAARGSEGASISFGSHFQLLVAGKKSTDLLREYFQPPLSSPLHGSLSEEGKLPSLHFGFSR